MVRKKKCSVCGETKLMSEFSRKVTSIDRRRPECKECQVKYNKKYWKKVTDKYPHKSRDRARKIRKEDPEVYMNRRLKYSFGITLDEYNEMFNQQKGCCAICGVHQSELNRVLNVDHDHETGEIRDLLCTKCNAGLGQYDDNPELVEKALEYIKRYKSK